MDIEIKLEQALKDLKQVNGWILDKGKERKSHGHHFEAEPYFEQAIQLDTAITALTGVLENLKKEG